MSTATFFVLIQVIGNYLFYTFCVLHLQLMAAPSEGTAQLPSRVSKGGGAGACSSGRPALRLQSHRDATSIDAALAAVATPCLSYAAHEADKKARAAERSALLVAFKAAAPSAPRKRDPRPPPGPGSGKRVRLGLEGAPARGPGGSKGPRHRRFGYSRNAYINRLVAEHEAWGPSGKGPAVQREMLAGAEAGAMRAHLKMESERAYVQRRVDGAYMYHSCCSPQFHAASCSAAGAARDDALAAAHAFFAAPATEGGPPRIATVEGKQLVVVYHAFGHAFSLKWPLFACLECAKNFYPDPITLGLFPSWASQIPEQSGKVKASVAAGAVPWFSGLGRVFPFEALKLAGLISSHAAGSLDAIASILEASQDDLVGILGYVKVTVRPSTLRTAFLRFSVFDETQRLPASMGITHLVGSLPCPACAAVLLASGEVSRPGSSMVSADACAKARTHAGTALAARKAAEASLQAPLQVYFSHADSWVQRIQAAAAADNGVLGPGQGPAASVPHSLAGPSDAPLGGGHGPDPGPGPLPVARGCDGGTSHGHRGAGASADLGPRAPVVAAREGAGAAAAPASGEGPVGLAGSPSLPDPAEILQSLHPRHGKDAHGGLRCCRIKARPARESGAACGLLAFFCPHRFMLMGSAVSQPSPENFSQYFVAVLFLVMLQHVDSIRTIEIDFACMLEQSLKLWIDDLTPSFPQFAFVRAVVFGIDWLHMYIHADDCFKTKGAMFIEGTGRRNGGVMAEMYWAMVSEPS